MADLLSARIEGVGDGAELPIEERPDRASKAKPAAKLLPVPPPLDSEQEEKHQLDEQA